MYRVADIDLLDYDDEHDYATLNDAEIAAIEQSVNDRVIAVFDLETAEGDNAGENASVFIRFRSQHRQTIPRTQQTAISWSRS